MRSLKMKGDNFNGRVYGNVDQNEMFADWENCVHVLMRTDMP